MSPLSDARKIVTYINSLPKFRFIKYSSNTYNHMGATLTDAGLQAGLNYRNVVYPRIMRLINERPRAKKTSDFLSIINKEGICELIRWSHPEKPRRIYDMALMLSEYGIESECDLTSWLECSASRERLMSIRGVGKKTVDYLYKLAGGCSIVIDRHLINFAFSAGILNKDYSEMKKIYEYVGDLMEIDYSSLDYTIWFYSSESKNKNGSLFEGID